MRYNSNFENSKKRTRKKSKRKKSSLKQKKRRTKMRGGMEYSATVRDEYGLPEDYQNRFDYGFDYGFDDDDGFEKDTIHSDLEQKNPIMEISILKDSLSQSMEKVEGLLKINHQLEKENKKLKEENKKLEKENQKLVKADRRRQLINENKEEMMLLAARHTSRVEQEQRRLAAEKELKEKRDPEIRKQKLKEKEQELKEKRDADLSREFGPSGWRPGGMTAAHWRSLGGWQHGAIRERDERDRQSLIDFGATLENRQLRVNS